MFLYVATRKKLGTFFTVILLTLVLLVVLVMQAASLNKTATKTAADPAARVAYLKSLNYTVDETVPETFENIEIPTVFSSVYENYNLLQKRAGMDLTPYKGQQVVRYTYKLLLSGREDVYAHLLQKGDCIIGGDITALSVEDGYELPLLRSETAGLPET